MKKYIEQKVVRITKRHVTDQLRHAIEYHNAWGYYCTNAERLYEDENEIVYLLTFKEQ